MLTKLKMHRPIEDGGEDWEGWEETYSEQFVAAVVVAVSQQVQGNTLAAVEEAVFRPAVDAVWTLYDNVRSHLSSKAEI